MTIYVAENARASQPSITPYEANDTVTARFVLALGTVAPAVGDILEMGRLPEGCCLDSIKVDTDQLDSGTALALNFGTLTGQPGDTVSTTRVNNNEFGNQTLGRVAGETVVTGTRIVRLPPQPVDRGIGFTLTAAAGTAVTGAAPAAGVNRGAWVRNAVYALNDYITIPGGAIMQATTGGQAQSGFDGFGNPVAISPNWNIGKGATTNDGSVVWTCLSAVIGLTMRYRPSRNLY